MEKEVALIKNQDVQFSKKKKDDDDELEFNDASTLLGH